MSKMNIERSKLIAAPIEKVYAQLNDFNNWTSWSPWLIMDPDAKVTVSKDTKSYEWEGNRVGSGKMKITEEKKNEVIHYDLNFIKPWKSFAKVGFYLSQEDKGTNVRWTMSSKFPFFLFFMKKSMEAYVGADYERGLDMLKDKVEQGNVLSKLNFVGISSYDGCKYMGIRKTCSIDDIEKEMTEDFTKLTEEYIHKYQKNIMGEPFSIYHKWDIVKRKVTYTAGVPVVEISEGLPPVFIKGKIPSTKVYKLIHTGPYRLLGNAYSTLYSMQRNKEFKVIKSIPPFEIYRNDPAKTPEKELITDIYFAVK